jgi:hypothetical protein
MPLSVYQAQKFLNSLFGSGTPATLYVALLLTAPSSTGGGTEVSGGGYARVAVTNNNTNWVGATSTTPSTSANGTTIAFPTASAAWGTPGWFGIYDAASGGNLLWWGTLVNPQAVASGATPEYTAGNLLLNLQ